MTDIAIRDLEQGCRMPAADWARLNRVEAFADPSLARHVAPFPPPQLMHVVSGLSSPADFAAHGADFWMALSRLAPKPLADYASVLDLGCGCGRLGRMFKGHPGAIHGCDIDSRLVEWTGANLPYYRATLTRPDAPLPYADASFELVISISILTHLNESSQDTLLRELHRVCRKDGLLMLTIHGERAMQRALEERKIWDMLAVDKTRFAQARERFERGQHGFILQDGHLTSQAFSYGITFIPQAYIASHWGQWFEVVAHASGGIHNFQDVVVLRPGPGA
jgi:SAM-dependent methyltransferase